MVNRWMCEGYTLPISRLACPPGQQASLSRSQAEEVCGRTPQEVHSLWQAPGSPPSTPLPFRSLLPCLGQAGHSCVYLVLHSPPPSVLTHPHNP